MIFRFFKAQAWPSGALHLPSYQAHRGYWKSGLTENTLAAFRAAREKDAQMCELDVQITKDKIPVVFHDEDLRRLAGRTEKVADLFIHEIQKYTEAPTLEEVLLDAGGTPFYNIELKSSDLLQSDLEAAIAAVIKKNQLQSRVMFSSFNPFALMRMARLLPQVPRALLVTLDSDSKNKIYLKKMWLWPLTKAHMLNLHYKMVTPELSGSLKKHHIPFAVWTVNDPETAQRMFALGAQSVISDQIIQSVRISSR